MDEGAVRRATVADAADVAALLHAFNVEFDAPTPGEAFLSQRVRELIASEAIVVLVAGEGPLGLAVLRLRQALWADGLDGYLEELYVVPERRGEGIGRALLDATLGAAREAGAVRIEIGTEETDAAARSLYESAGFTNYVTERDGTRAQMLFYERDLGPGADGAITAS